MSREKRAPLFVILAVAAVALIAPPALAASVTPVVVPGNPNCAALGHAGSAFKVDPPVSGTYALDAVNTVTVTFSGGGKVLDWSATIPIDRVIVKGGDAANVYNYDPEALSDTGLLAPVNQSGGPAEISHVEFCFDYEVAVTKTAVPAFTRTFTWAIEKTADPATLEMFRGDSATVTYTVAATRTVVDSAFAVSGEIVIANPSPDPATIAAVTDFLSDGTEAPVACPGTTIAPFGTMTCTYAVPLGSADPLTNTATVATTGVVGGGTGTADVVFGDPTTVVGFPSVTVNDTNGMTWPAPGSATWTYTRTFSCDADEGVHGNTATIVETGQPAPATVTVECHALIVKKTAFTELDRTFAWTIEKSVDQPEVVLSPGQMQLVNYTVGLEAVPADSNHFAHGTITVTNPAPIAALLDGVSDVLSEGSAVVDCGVAFPYVLGALAEISCTWEAQLASAAPRLNTATATLRNVPSGTTDFSGTAFVDFTGATIELIGECVALADTFEEATLPEEACVAGGLVQQFAYTRFVGPYDVCGKYRVENVASFEATDTGATGEDDEVVEVDVPCPPGCTLTPGYWKTHSANGPAPYDDTWAQLGEETSFFLSEKTYYEVLWTAPAGNAYYILAHAWIATKLNVLNGATAPEDVQEAFAEAEQVFIKYTPAEIGALKAGKEMQLRAEILGYAFLLDEYNNGLAAGGPPHCSE